MIYFIVSYLQDSVERDERPWPAHSGRAVNDDRPLLGADPFAESAHESDERLRRFRNAEIRPRREVEVTDRADGVAAHDPELGDVPVREVTLVQDCHLLKNYSIFMFFVIKYRFFICDV